jgi:glycosyltransferase involved in cell wall biosynthesis
MNLVEAVQRLDRQDFRLDIYGDGDCRDEIIKISKVDNRIKYCGQKPRNEILKKQQEVFLLVNPRTSEGEFTKYSFPSKTMEYLASGTPTLIYRLPGIPDEYYEHCFALEDSSIETLSHKINEILDLSGQELSRMGNEARQFILDNKNPVKQVGKLNSILEKLN